MSRIIRAEPLTAEAFAPFGDVIALGDTPDQIINAGLCGRHHDLARLDWQGGRAGISLFDAEPRALPHTLDLMERHPLGAQAFLPMHEHPFLVVVAPDAGGEPGRPRAFTTSGREGVNYFCNTWHGVLTPLAAGRLFAVVDRIASAHDTSGNLEEHRFDEPWVIER